MSTTTRRIMAMGGEFYVPPFHEHNKELRCLLQRIEDQDFLLVLHVNVDDAVADYTITVSQPVPLADARKYAREFGDTLPRRVLLTLIPSAKPRGKYGVDYNLNIANLEDIVR